MLKRSLLILGEYKILVEVPIHKGSGALPQVGAEDMVDEGVLPPLDQAVPVEVVHLLENVLPPLGRQVRDLVGVGHFLQFRFALGGDPADEGPDPQPELFLGYELDALAGEHRRQRGVLGAEPEEALLLAVQHAVVVFVQQPED